MLLDIFFIFIRLRLKCNIGTVLKNFIVTSKEDQQLLSDVINSIPGTKGPQGDRITVLVYGKGYFVLFCF